MNNQHNDRKIFGKVRDGPVAKNTRIEFEHLEESLLSQYRMLNAQAFLADDLGVPKMHEALRSLALNVLELWESIAECAEEYDSLIPNKEA